MSDISKPKRMFSGRLPDFWLLLAILAATGAVYSGLAGHDFVSLDDLRYVADNPRVKAGLSLDNAAWAFRTLEAEFWHPLTWLSYMLDTQLYGGGPGGYLLTNLLLHLLNCTFLFVFLRRATGRLWESWLATALFALHPLHVEPVAWISGRKELLCACFWLLTLLAYERYCRHPGWRRYVPVLILFALGMMAKPMIVTLPFVLLLLDYWPLSREGRAHPAMAFSPGEVRRWRSLVMEKVPLLVVSAAGMMVALIAQQQGGGLVSSADLPPANRIATVLLAYAVYLKKSIWPGALAVFYPFPAVISGRMAAAAPGVLLAITALVGWRVRRQPYLLTGWFWFLGTLVPVIGIVKVGEFFIADRYMYLPLTGILIMVAYGLKTLVDRLPHRQTWMVIIPAMMIGAYAPATIQQIQTWRDSETLYRHALAVTENNFLAHHALGQLLAERNDRAGAIDQFARAAAIRPDKAVLWVTLGRALAFDDRWPRAEEAFVRASRLEPEHPAVWFYRGCARAAGGDIRRALDDLVKCLEKGRAREPGIARIYPKAMDFYENGLYYESRGQWVLAGQYDLQFLALIHVDLSRRQLTRLAVAGYDQWLAEFSSWRKGVD